MWWMQGLEVFGDVGRRWLWVEAVGLYLVVVSTDHHAGSMPECPGPLPGSAVHQGSTGPNCLLPCLVWHQAQGLFHQNSPTPTHHLNNHYSLGALPLDPSRGLSHCTLSVPFLLPFSVRSISLWAAYEPVVANLFVVCPVIRLDHCHFRG